MSIANYPNGFSQGITIRGMPLNICHPGKMFWVSNSSVASPNSIGGSDSNDGTYQKPFSTVSHAINMCVASRGDVVMIKAGHVETVASAAAIAMSKSGVAVVGLGVGSLRPTFNFTATASTITMSAANCSFKNILFTGGIDAVVSPIVVSAADCTIEDCELKDVTGQMTDGILTTAGADRLKILNHKHTGDSASGTNAAIALVGGTGIEITIKRMDGNFAVGGIDVRTTATSDLFVHEVQYFRTRSSANIFLVDTITASTGQIGPNIYLRLKDNAANITESVTGATFVVMDNIYVVNLAGEKGMLINWVASTDA